MDEQLKTNLTSRHHWSRLLFMVLFALLLQVASLVMWAVVAVQFLWSLITGADNEQLRRFGHSLSAFIFEALQFLTYNTERKPFPFSDWPDLPPKREEVEEVTVVDPVPERTAAATPSAGDEIVEETREVVEDVEHAEADTPPEAVADQDSEKKDSPSTSIAQDAGASASAKPDESTDAKSTGNDSSNDKH